jgi:hypothetical protein
MAGTNVGSLYVEIGAKLDGLKDGLKQTDQLLNKTADTARNMGNGVETGMNQVSGAVNVVGLIAKSLVAAKAIDMVADGMVSMVNSARAWGESIDTMGDQFGMSGQEASKWAVAMGHVGLSVSEGAMQLNYFTRQLATAAEAQASGKETSSGFADALAKLGVSATDARGQVRSFNELMPEIMDAFSRLPAGIESSSIAMELFGARGGTKFLDFLRQGSAGLDEATLKAQQFGLSMDTIDANKVEELGFKLNDLGMRFEGLKVSIGLGLIDPLTKALDLLNQSIEGWTWLAQGMPGFTPFAAPKNQAEQGALGFDMDRAEAARRAQYPLGWGAFESGLFMGEVPFGPEQPSKADNAAVQAYYNWLDKQAAKAPKSTLELLRSKGKGVDDTIRSGLNSQLFAGGASSLGGGSGVAASQGLNDYLTRAFGNAGAAQSWMGAFSAEHGGAQATSVDVRDKMAGDAFAKKYGRAATQSEWEQRYYKGSFEGMEGEEAELDKIFGPNGTLITKMDEKNRADAENWQKLLDAFSKAKDPTYSVQIVGKRLTD